MIVFSTSSYTVTFLPSTTSLTLLPSASFLATLALIVTSSKLSFSFTAEAIRPTAILRISLALDSVVLIFREADNHILILFESYIKIHLLSHVSRNGRWSGWYGGGIVVVYIKKSA